MKKREWGLVLMMSLVLAGYFIIPDRDFINPSVPEIALVERPTESTRADSVLTAIESVFELRFDAHKTGGTGFLVGRERTADGFRYRAITAFHVMQDILKLVEKDPKLVLRPHIAFHSWRLGIIENVVEIRVESYSEDMDWIVISFELSRDIPCLPLSDEKTFRNISPADPLFLLGSEDLEGVVIFRCNLVAPTNKHPTPSPGQWDQSRSPLKAHQFPFAYFRLSHQTIPGASGGPVIDINGRVIGIVTAYQNNTSLALRASIILSQIGASSDLLLVEK